MRHKREFVSNVIYSSKFVLMLHFHSTFQRVKEALCLWGQTQHDHDYAEMVKLASEILTQPISAAPYQMLNIKWQEKVCKLSWQ